MTTSGLATIYKFSDGVQGIMMVSSARRWLPYSKTILGHLGKARSEIFVSIP